MQSGGGLLLFIELCFLIKHLMLCSCERCCSRGVCLEDSGMLLQLGCYGIRQELTVARHGGLLGIEEVVGNL